MRQVTRRVWLGVLRGPDRPHRLRFTEASLYTLRDTPMFTCRKKPVRELLDDLA